MAKFGVVFIRHVRPYNEGEYAGFEFEEAEDLVKRKLAKWDARVNPGGKLLEHHELHEDIRKHRESIEAADKAAGLTPAARAVGTPVAQAVPAKQEVVEKGAETSKRRG